MSTEIDQSHSLGMIPRALEDWTLEVIQELLEFGCHEDIRFDWKEMLPHTKDQNAKLRMIEGAVAMANAGGGFIIFGVADKQRSDGSSRIAGMMQDNEFAARLKGLLGQSDPPIPFLVSNPPIAIPESDGLKIYPVQVFSRDAPHSFRNIFYLRTPGGTKEALGTDGVKELFVGVKQAIFDAPVANEIQKTRLRLHTSTSWETIGSVLSDLSPYATIGSPRIRADVAEALHDVGTYVRRGMPIDLAMSMGSMARGCLVLEDFITPDVLRGYRYAIEAGFDLAYDGSLKIMIPRIAREGAEVLEQALRVAIKAKLTDIKELAIDRFDSAINAANRANPPFRDASAFLTFRMNQALEGTRDHAPDDLDLRMLQDTRDDSH